MKLSANRGYIRAWLLLYFCLAGLQVYPGIKPDTLRIGESDIYPIGDHLHWMRTAEKLSAADAYRLIESGNGERLAPTKSINSDVADAYFWLTFTLSNTSVSAKSLFYEFNYPFINNIEVYRNTESGFEQWITTGAKFLFSTREYPYHDFVFPIGLEIGETTTFLIMVESAGARFSTTPRLVSGATFKKTEQRVYTFMGAIAGIMLFNVVINLFLGVSLEDKIHYRYAAYVIAALCWVMTSVGFSNQFLYPDRPSLFHIDQFVTSAVTMALMAQLTITFLGLKDKSLWLYRLLRICSWIMLFLVVVRVGTHVLSLEPGWIKKMTGNISVLGTAIIAIGMIWAAIVRVWQGYRPAWFYLIAMCFLSASIFLTCYIILTTNDLSVLVRPPTFVQIGLIIETLIIFAGIIYRYALFKKEKEVLAMKLANQQLEMTGNIIAAQEDERKRLAQDLHDDMGATLSTLLLHITNQPIGDMQQYQARSLAITKKALADLRHISHDLLPKDFTGLGLFQALRNRADELNTFSVTRFWINTDGDDRLLSEIQAITLYRIANELINNTIKHARASRSNIDVLIADDHINLIVEDDGIGFEAQDSQVGIGMKNIYSRVMYLNGEINIDNNKQGTTIIIVAPL